MMYPKPPKKKANSGQSHYDAILMQKLEWLASRAGLSVDECYRQIDTEEFKYRGSILETEFKILKTSYNLLQERRAKNG